MTVPRITFDNMRFGSPPEDATIEENPFARFTADIFGQQVWMVSEALGADIDEVHTDHDTHDGARVEGPARRSTRKAGTVSGQRFLLDRDGARGESRIEIEVLWTVGGFYPDTLAEAA